MIPRLGAPLLALAWRLHGSPLLALAWRLHGSPLLALAWQLLALFLLGESPFGSELAVSLGLLAVVEISIFLPQSIFYGLDFRCRRQ